jgi:ribonuclease inhibitor
MNMIIIDCANILDEAAFWETYLEITKPADAHSFGRNLDAFWDALNGGPGNPGPCRLRFVNVRSLRNLRAGLFLNAFEDIARESELIPIELRELD